MEAKQEPTRKNKQAGELITCKGRLSPDNSAVQKSHTTPPLALDSSVKRKKKKKKPETQAYLHTCLFQVTFQMYIPEILTILTKEVEKIIVVEENNQ